MRTTLLNAAASALVLVACGGSDDAKNEEATGSVRTSMLDAGSSLDAGPALIVAADGALSVAPPSGPITYYKHAKPIMDAKCVRCHVAGTVAPFSLDTYDLAKGFGKLAQLAINAGTMPPWKFDSDCNEYIGDYSLSLEEKAILNAWVDQGFLEGDVHDQGPKVDIGSSSLSRVDVTLQMPEPYAPVIHPDEYRCFPIPWPKDHPVFMTGFSATPGNPKIVHHLETYYVPANQAATIQQLDDADPGPGYTCFGGPGAGNGTIGGWAPGTPGYDYPDGIGIPIEPGSVIVLQVHYNTTDPMPAVDQSKLELKVDDTAIEGGYDFWTNPVWSELHQMPIPAGAPDVGYTWTASPTLLNGGQAIQLYQAALHMHQTGRTGYMKIHPADGSHTKCILQINDWDFHWQSGARLQNSITINPGDTIEMQCGFDNSAAHQPVGPDGNLLPPVDQNWGEGTAQEMCLGILLWGPAKK